MKFVYAHRRGDAPRGCSTPLLQVRQRIQLATGAGQIAASRSRRCRNFGSAAWLQWRAHRTLPTGAAMEHSSALPTSVATELVGAATECSLPALQWCACRRSLPALQRSSPELQWSACRTLPTGIAMVRSSPLPPGVAMEHSPALHWSSVRWSRSCDAPLGAAMERSPVLLCSIQRRTQSTAPATNGTSATGDAIRASGWPAADIEERDDGRGRVLRERCMIRERAKRRS